MLHCFDFLERNTRRSLDVCRGKDIRTDRSDVHWNRSCSGCDSREVVAVGAIVIVYDACQGKQGACESGRGNVGNGQYSVGGCGDVVGLFRRRSFKFVSAFYII